jgi:ankyrin repeat protein
MNLRSLGRWGVGLVAGFALATVQLAAAGNTSLIEAVKAGQIEAVRALAKQPANVLATEVDGTTALHWAVHLDNLAAVDLLILSGAKVQAANRYGATPLWLACINGNAAIVDRLLTAGADPNTTMPEGDTALMTAARTGKVDVVRALLLRGADVNAHENWKNQTALMWAAARNNVGTVETLLEAGADIQARTKFTKPPTVGGKYRIRESEESSDVALEAGFTPLLFAARAGALETVKVLLAHGASVHDTGTDGMSPLVLAIASTHYQLADYLLEQGADPNASRQGWTPLHQVIFTRRPNLGQNNPGMVAREPLDSLTFARKLIAKGANPNRPLTKDGNSVNVGRHILTHVGATPFWLAAQLLDFPMMKLLLEAGADPLRPNATNTTPLMAAAGLAMERPGEQQGTQEDVAKAVKMLLDLGADPNTIDENGNTALHGTAVWGSNGAVEHLVAAGAKLDVKNAKGLTPWSVANHYYFADAVLAQPQTAALLKRLMEERGMKVE